MEVDIPLPQFAALLAKAENNPAITWDGKEWAIQKYTRDFTDDPPCIEATADDVLHIRAHLSFPPMSEAAAKEYVQRMRARPGWWKQADWIVSWVCVRGHPAARFEDWDERFKPRLVLPVMFGAQSIRPFLMAPHWERDTTDSAMTILTQPLHAPVKGPVQLELFDFET